MLKALLAATSLFLCAPVVAEEFKWTVEPSYSTPQGRVDEKLTINIPGKLDRVLYSQSRAVIIVESTYVHSDVWDSISDIARSKADKLKNALEKEGFFVEEWDNLSSKDLKTQLSEIFSRYGNLYNGRMFFYYYGHGYLMRASDPNGPDRTYLVPVDAPDPEKDRSAFLMNAINIRQLREYAVEADTKHMFFALEACYAGAIIQSLGGPPTIQSGYLLSEEFQHRSREVLTAGGVNKEIPADGIFTDALIEGLDKADINDDGYVTGQELSAFIKTVVPQRAPFQHPEVGAFSTDDGDIVLSSNKSKTQSSPASAMKSCRRPENGLERWQHSESWHADSGWRGGGSDPTSYCGGVKLARERQHPERTVAFLASHETHQSIYNPFKHDEYRYTCEFVDQWEPIYKSASSPSCD